MMRMRKVRCCFGCCCWYYCEWRIILIIIIAKIQKTRDELLQTLNTYIYVNIWIYIYRWKSEISVWKNNISIYEQSNVYVLFCCVALPHQKVGADILSVIPKSEISIFLDDVFFCCCWRWWLWWRWEMPKTFTDPLLRTFCIYVWCRIFIAFRQRV